MATGQPEEDDRRHLDAFADAEQHPYWYDDVGEPDSNPTLVRNEITVGVGGGNYGVAQNTLRQQMAVFLLKAMYGICFVPPPL